LENVQNSKPTDSRNPENHPILARWEGVRAARGVEPAVISQDGTVARTFSDLERGGREWAERFEELRDGASIGIQLANGPEWIEALLGAWRTGRTVVPMDRELTGQRRDAVEQLCGVGARVLGPDPMDCVRTPWEPVAWDPPALVKLTSGSTGEPRAICFTAAALLADADAVCAGMGIGQDDRNFGAISFAHSYGFSNLVTPLLCRGVPVVAAPDLLPRAILAGLAASRATVLPGVPALFRTLAEFKNPSEALRLCISAGALLPVETATHFRRGWGLKVHAFYGASECGGICYDAGATVDRPPGFVGQPLPGVKLDDADSEGIRVSGPAMGIGYFPAAPGDALSDGAFRPPDFVERTVDGFVLGGRSDDVINVAGRKVNPAAIEQVVLQCPGVTDAVVLGHVDVLRGQEIVGCVTGSASEPDLRVFCAERLPSWQCPRRWLFWEAIPLTSRGKRDRATLLAKVGEPVGPN